MNLGYPVKVNSYNKPMMMTMMLMVMLLRVYATELGLSSTPKERPCQRRTIKRKPTNQKKKHKEEVDHQNVAADDNTSTVTSYTSLESGCSRRESKPLTTSYHRGFG